MAFDVKNTLAVTKAAVAQMIGKGYMDVETGNIAELNDQYIVELGEKLDIQEGSIENGSPADIFFKAMMSQVSKIVIDTRSYVKQLPKLYKDTAEWGLVSEHIRVDLSDVYLSEMWNPEGFINFSDEGGAEYAEHIAAMEHACYKPAVHAKIYKKAKGIMVALTVAREQMFTAFRGLDELNSFVAALFNSVENTLALKAEIYALMTVSMLIATTRANNNEINVLAEYKTATGDSTITAATAFENGDFVRFAMRRIAETKAQIRRFTALYNNHESVTFASNANLILLNQFAVATAFNVKADVYNMEQLDIGDYDTVTSWQAVTSGSDKFGFNTASTISLTTEAATEAGIDAPESNKTITGVIAVLYDEYAAGVNVERTKTTSKYVAVTDYVNYFTNNLMNYAVNTDYPAVSFVVRD